MPLPGPSASLVAFAFPDKRCGVSVPSSGCVLEGVDYLLRALGVCSCNRSILENTLNRLGHIQPAAPQRGVERDHTMFVQPFDQLVRLVSRQIIPHQNYSWCGQLVERITAPEGLGKVFPRLFLRSLAALRLSFGRDFTTSSI